MNMLMYQMADRGNPAQANSCKKCLAAGKGWRHYSLPLYHEHHVANIESMTATRHATCTNMSINTYSICVEAPNRPVEMAVIAKNYLLMMLSSGCPDHNV